MTNTLRALLVGALVLIGAAPGFAADLPKKTAAVLDAPDLPPATVNWTGPYIGLGIGAGLQTTKEADFDTVSISNDNWIVSGRVGYRYQPHGSIFVLGAGGEVNYTGGKLAPGAELSLSYDGFGEFGIATGGVILTVQAGVSSQPVNIKGGFGDIDFTGPFAGVELGADIGGNWVLFVNGRGYFDNTDTVEGFKLESTRYEIKTGIMKRF